ncbi:tetratricopeptide repeat protein [Altericista sp. CCNU0014]|uniref:tetratricopeptide repeat protein n=1 Tax=Altericista sp. CCNU0014 TaxID=3082949 RepID=UPI0038509B4B
MSSLDDGKLAFDNGQYDIALSELLPFAERGNAEAQCMVGNIYHLGLGIPSNLTEAVKWYAASADRGYAVASNNLATIFQTGGENFPVDAVESQKWRNKSIEQGFIHSSL